MTSAGPRTAVQTYDEEAEMVLVKLSLLEHRYGAMLHVLEDGESAVLEPPVSQRFG
jgi:hypothetical protein